MNNVNEQNQLRTAAEINNRLAANRIAILRYRSPTIQPCSRVHTDGEHHDGDTTAIIRPFSGNDKRSEPQSTEQDEADINWLSVFLAGLVTGVLLSGFFFWLVTK